jgi:hypothetical protein
VVVVERFILMSGQSLNPWERTHQAPIRTTRVSQTTETEVTFMAAPGVNLRYAYARSGDSVANQIEGQDYLIFQHNDQRLVFVVCDGVGSSFCGHLAARILGERLLEWLWTLDIAYIEGSGALTEAATSFLRRLQVEGQREVDGYEVPVHFPPLIRQALEQQRGYGSEAIFAAARIDHPGPYVPDGALTLCWMGDTQLHTLDEDGNEMNIGAEWTSKNRWSTTQGVKGKLSAVMSKLKGVGRLLAFSDGLSTHADDLANYSDDDIERAIYAGGRAATSDDVAFMDVVIRTPRYEGYEGDPDPGAERPSLEQIWNPTNGDSYELRWGWPGGGGAHFIVQEAGDPAFYHARTYEVSSKESSWRPPTPQPGRYYYRVRAVRRFGGISPWSELRWTQVAYPPPSVPKIESIAPAATGVAVEWSDVGEMLDYVLEEATTPDFSDARPVYRGHSTSWSAAEEYSPGTYYYRVQACSDGGPSAWSQPESIAITVPPPPTPHLGDIFFGGMHGDYTLRWTDVQRAERYELEERDAETGETQIVTLKDTTHTVRGKAVGEYAYRVRVCHAYGCSEWSNERIAEIAPLPPGQAPQITVEGPDPQRRVTLAWTPVPEADHYLVAISEEDSFRYAREYEETGTSLVLPRREPGELFCRACAVNAGGEGPWSTVAHIQIAPRAPDWIEARWQANAQQAEISWGEVGEQVTYRVERVPPGSDDSAKGELAYEGTETHCLAAISDDMEQVVYRVRAEVSSCYSSWQYSEAIRVQPALAVPQMAAPQVNEYGELLLEWDAISEADRYVIERALDRNFVGAGRADCENPHAIFKPPAGGKYWFRVQACRGQRCGEFSRSVSISVSGPAAPKLWTTASKKAHTAYELTWSGVPGCRSYELQESTEEGFGRDATRSFTIAHPEQKILIPGHSMGQYYYRLRAIDRNDHPSVWSRPIIVDVMD